MRPSGNLNENLLKLSWVRQHFKIPSVTYNPEFTEEGTGPLVLYINHKHCTDEAYQKLKEMIAFLANYDQDKKSVYVNKTEEIVKDRLRIYFHRIPDTAYAIDQAGFMLDAALARLGIDQDIASFASRTGIPKTSFTGEAPIKPAEILPPQTPGQIAAQRKPGENNDPPPTGQRVQQR